MKNSAGYVSDHCGCRCWLLMLGKYLKRKCSILEKFCIPAPVIGGVIFAVFTCICYVTGIAEFSFDDILKECRAWYFSSPPWGFQANLKVLKSGGKALIVFLGLVIGLIFCQNFLAVGLAKLTADQPCWCGSCHRFHPDGGRPRYCRCFRSGAGGDFGICRRIRRSVPRAATFGLIAGSMMGGPIGKTSD